MHCCQRTMKTLKTLKSLENKHGAWKNLEIWKIQNKTLKSLDFMTATYHNFHNFGLFVIICFKNQNVDTFIIIFIISACFENEFWKKCLLLFSSVVVTHKCHVSIYLIWTLKKAYYYLVVANSEKVSVLFDMNSGKSVYYCFGSNSLRKCQYLLFDMNPGKSV